MVQLFLEKDLEDIIYNSDREELFDRGLNIYGKMFRQLRIGNYGIADLVCVDRIEAKNKSDDDVDLVIKVIELKRDLIDVNTFLQAVRYVSGISSYINKRKPNLKVNYVINLVGLRTDKTGDFCFITDMFVQNHRSALSKNNVISLSIITYDITLDGIFFNRDGGYKLSNEGF